jgi:pimeloyl-ACP methyl ester carboxylesterase
MNKNYLFNSFYPGREIGEFVQNLAESIHLGEFMKTWILALLLSPALAFAQTSFSPSLLDQTVQVPGFGAIRYRAPVVSNQEFPILLVHGVYGGASHRTFREILPLLDADQQRVYIVDLPGAGESDKPKRAYKIEDLDLFLEKFIETVIKSRTTVVAESLMTASALKVSALRPDLVRRLVLLNPSGVSSLNSAPSVREQQLYDRLFLDETASTQFYQNLLVDNSLRYFLRFGFFDDARVDEALLNDFREMRSNIDQKYLTISFVGGQLYRSFKDSADQAFVPALLVFGAEYENFGDNQAAKASEFKALRPDFEYLEIPSCGASVQREKPRETASAIVQFAVRD